MFRDVGASLDFKHLEEAFGYFRACTLISLPTYTFGKQFIIAELGEIGFDHNPNCHSVYSLPVQSGFVQFLLSPHSKCNFKTSNVRAATAVGNFLYQIIQP